MSAVCATPPSARSGSDSELNASADFTRAGVSNTFVFGTRVIWPLEHRSVNGQYPATKRRTRPRRHYFTDRAECFQGNASDFSEFLVRFLSAAGELRNDANQRGNRRRPASAVRLDRFTGCVRGSGEAKCRISLWLGASPAPGRQPRGGRHRTDGVRIALPEGRNHSAQLGRRSMAIHCDAIRGLASSQGSAPPNRQRTGGSNHE